LDAGLVVTLLMENAIDKRGAKGVLLELVAGSEIGCDDQ